jgi:hypothetical protein
MQGGTRPAEGLLPAQLVALWGELPPPHDVRCLTAAARPPSVWTGGADGALVRWLLDHAGAPAPVACLLGHAAAVVTLAALPGGDTDDSDRVVRAHHIACSTPQRGASRSS